MSVLVVLLCTLSGCMEARFPAGATEAGCAVTLARVLERVPEGVHVEGWRCEVSA